MSKVILITGCSNGIGRLTARLFADQGWQVVATARNTESIEPHKNIAAVYLDLYEEDSIRAAVSTTAERFGSIDVLVNNAGWGLFGPFEGASLTQLDAYAGANLRGPVTLMQLVLPMMRANRSGTIINVSSLAGRRASPFMSAYNLVKFGLEGLSESLWFELSLHGIRMKLIQPAHFKTNFISRSLHLTSHPAYDAAFENYMGWVRKEDATAPDPAPVAQTIYRAATDNSSKLRYPVGNNWMHSILNLLPEGIWRSLNAEGMTRPSK